MSSVATFTASIFLILGAHALLDIAAIVIGLLTFFKGRKYVRHKYGKK